MAILDEHKNHIPLPGDRNERMLEAIVRTVEQVQARMYTDIPMSKLSEEGIALKALTEAYLMLRDGAKPKSKEPKSYLQDI